MCQHGDTVEMLVPMPAHLSYTGERRWDVKAVDRCLADLVRALNTGGAYTANCCCGHGAQYGEILLHDGRVLVVMSEAEWRAKWLAGAPPASLDV